MTGHSAADFFDEIAKPPHNIEMEQAILGGVLVNNLAFHAAGRLRAEHFYEPLHAYTWAAIGRLTGQGKTADYLTLEEELLAWARSQGLQGDWLRGYLGKLVGTCAAVLDVPDYAEQLIELAGRRCLCDFGAALANKARDMTCQEGLHEHLAAARAQLDDMTVMFETRSPWRNVGNVVDRMMSALMEPPERYSTGLAALDNAMCGGMAAGEVYGFEARMKGFKTGSLGTIALSLMSQSVPFLFVACEMGSCRIMERLISHSTGCNAVRFRKRQDPEDLVSRCRTFSHTFGRAPAYLSDEPGIKFDRLRAMASEAVYKLGIKVLFLDYWQLVTGQRGRQSSADHLTAVAQWLAEFAGVNNVAVAVTSQTNREGYGYGSDGLAKACDWLGRIHKLDATDARSGPCEAVWIEMLHNRDGSDHDIGSADHPAFIIDKVGPVLRDAAGMELIKL